MSELARVQEYAGRHEESLRTCHEAVELARRAEDVRLQAALQLRLADTLERLGDPASARLHRGTAERLLGRSATRENRCWNPLIHSNRTLTPTKSVVLPTKIDAMKG